MKIFSTLLIFLLIPCTGHPDEFKDEAGKKKNIFTADSINAIAEISLDNNPELTKTYANEALL